MPEQTDLNFSNDDPELLEKIVDHFTARIRQGEHPAIVEYQEQYPQHKEDIQDLLSSVAMIEQLKPSASSASGSRPLLDKVAQLNQIGNYKIVREVGRGGMGVVFEAVHDSLGRRVAIKVMPTPMVNSQKYIERFQREAKAAAKLHHTNIVSVFGVGEGDGFHYYVMDFIDGQPLSHVIEGLNNSGSSFESTATLRDDKTRLDLMTNQELDFSDASNDSASDGLQPSAFLSRNSSDRATIGDKSSDLIAPVPKNRGSSKHFRWTAKIGAAMADALVYAHQNKILHRDIKPSNMVLDPKGVPWITDFGLAKDASNEINLTQTGDVIGTPRYLAPESLEGKYDERSEVYCLGLTLYEMATLRSAYPSGTTAEVIRAIATTNPTAPRKINTRIPLDLSTIIEKSIAPEPKDRYQTARQLHTDLVAFLDDRPIAARPPSTFENVVRWGRRNPLAAALSAVSALLLGLVAVSASIGYLYVNDAYKKEAEKSAELIRETERARASEAETKEQFARAEANVEIAIDAFDEMFSQVVSRGSSAGINIEGFDELMGIESSVTREDAAFLKRLLEFYDLFATENADNESLRTESARAFRRAGNIYQMVGDFSSANNAYKKSVDLYQRLFDESPESKELLIILVQTKTEYSRSLRRTEQSTSVGGGRLSSGAASVRQNQDAISLLKNFPTEQIDDELKFELAKTLNTLGSINTLQSVLSSGNMRKQPGPARFDFFGLRGSRQPQDQRKGKGKGSRPGNDPRFGKSGGGQGGIGRPGGRNRMGDGRRGEPPRGEGEPRRGARGDVGRKVNLHSSKSLKLLDELVEAHPDNIRYRSARANTYSSLAWCLTVPDPSKAHEMRRLAISELESLIELEPENPSYRFQLAMVCLVRDPAIRSEEDDLLTRALSLSKELTSQLPDVPDFHSLYGSACCQNAESLIQKEELQSALESLTDAKASFDRVSELLPSNTAKHRQYRIIYPPLIDLAQAAKKGKKMEILESATKLLSEVPKRENPDWLPWR